MKPSADWETPAPPSTPYRFRVIAEDEEYHPNGPFIIEYYQGSILGGSWKALTTRKVPDRPYRFWDHEEAERFKSLFEKKNPEVLNFHLAIQRDWRLTVV